MTPYSYIPVEQTFIAANPAFKGDDWGRSIFEGIKERIKEYLLLEQDNRCPYCQSRLRLEIMYPHVEHIAHKSKHFRFMFEPKNLVMSCQPCNTNKNDKEALRNPLIPNYPNRGDAFRIVHPYFDNYVDHIEIRGSFSYGITAKGGKTIDYCDLNREQLLISRKKIREGSQLCEMLKCQSTEAPPELKATIDKFCLYFQSLD